LQKNLDERARPICHLNSFDDAKWFALYTTSRHEKRVAQHLDQRRIEFFLPLYRSQGKWSDGSKVTLELPLSPSYLFVRIQRNQRAGVLDVPGALAVVIGTGGQPAAIPESSVDMLRRVTCSHFPHGDHTTQLAAVVAVGK
jgi:transcriptional antiterminator NusG